MDRRGWRILLGSVLAGIALAACERTASPNALDACGLLEASAVASVLAGRASTGLPEHLGSRPFEVDRCRWSTADRALALLASRSPDGDAAATREAFAEVRATAARDGVAVVDVPGIGDAAWWESDRLSNHLHVLAGPTSLTFTTRSPATAAPPPELLAAARSAVGRLAATRRARSAPATDHAAT